MGKVALYTLCNDKYFEPVSVMIFSFIINNRWFDGDIVVFCDEGRACGLSVENRARLGMLSKKLRIEEIDSSKYKKAFDNSAKNGGSGNPCWFYKFEAFKKDDYDVKVYLDGDIVVNKDIGELFHNVSDKVFVVEDQNIILCDYFNAGVMSIPCKSMPDDFYDRLMFFAETYNKDVSFKNRGSGRGSLGDQDVFNELIENKKFIGVEYNYPPNVKIGVPRITYKEAKIIHYYASYKPWDGFMMFDESHLLYYRYYYILTRLGK